MSTGGDTGSESTGLDEGIIDVAGANVGDEDGSTGMESGLDDDDDGGGCTSCRFRVWSIQTWSKSEPLDNLLRRAAVELLESGVIGCKMIRWLVLLPV